MPRIKVALAPMAGVTDSAFRLMNKLGGADLVYSEMAHVNAISHNSEKVLAMLKASPYEFPYVVQLFGKDPKYFAQAAKIISERGTPVMRYKPFGKGQIEFIERLLGQLTVYGLRFTAFYSRFLNFQNKSKTGNRELGTRNWKLGTKYCIPSGLDINLGCPARKVFGHGGGAALWKDLKNVRAILEAVLNSTNLPVSAKVRAAVGGVTLFHLLDAIADLPLKRIMIHGRTYEQKFSGPIDVKLIKKAIKKYPQFEFWANGGIVDSASAQKIAEETDCLNLGIARGSLGNPLLANEIKSIDKDEKPKAITELTAYGLRLTAVIAYIHTILNYQSKGARGIIEMRKHLCWYFQGFPGAATWRKKLVRVTNIRETEKILTKISQWCLLDEIRTFFEQNPDCEF